MEEKSFVDILILMGLGLMLYMKVQSCWFIWTCIGYLMKFMNSEPFETAVPSLIINVDTPFFLFPFLDFENILGNCNLIFIHLHNGVGLG